MNPSTDHPARAIARMTDRWEAEGLRMHGFILMQKGRILAEGSWSPFQNTVPHRMYSVSKSMTSLAIGLLEAEGRLKLSDPICDYFPDKLPPTVPGPLRRTTIRDMLCMASCHRKSAFKQVRDDDWTRAFFTVPPTHEPGTVFNYDTSSSHTLSALVQRLSGMPLDRFLQTRLFDSLGATDAKRWLTDPMGVCQGGSGLVMTLRDFAKIAQFCLTGGKGTALEGYLAQAVQKHIDTPLQDHTEERYGYGYQFWRVRNNGFAMYGMGGQLAVCLPELEAVLCTTADTQLDPNGVQKIYDAFWQELYPVLAAGRTSTQAEWDALRDKLQTLAFAPVPNDDSFARPIGQAYAFPKNPTGFSYLCLQDQELVFENASGRHRLPFGIGAWAGAKFPGTSEPCITSGGWIFPGLFRLQCYLTGDDPNGVDMLLCYQGDRITVQMKSVRIIHMTQYAGIASGKVIG